MVLIRNRIAIGDDDIQREGDVIQVRGVSMRGEIVLPGDASGAAGNLQASDSVRVVLVYDRRPDGAFPAVTDVLNNADIVSHYNHDNTRNGGRFRILYDKTFDVTAPTDTHYNGALANYYTYRHERSIHMNVNKRFKQPLMVKYRDNGDGEVDDIDKGNIFAICFSQNEELTIALLNKVEFKDA